MFGSLKKWKKHLRRLDEKKEELSELLEIFVELFKEIVLDEEIDLGLKDIEINIEDPIEEEDLELEQIKMFMEEYVGLIISGFSSYSDDIANIEDYVAGKILTEVRISGNIINLKISTMSGEEVGIVKISPTINGQFAEKGHVDYPASFSRYRILFYGGDAIEYMDSKNEGTITFRRIFRG